MLLGELCAWWRQGGLSEKEKALFVFGIMFRMRYGVVMSVKLSMCDKLTKNNFINGFTPSFFNFSSNSFDTKQFSNKKVASKTGCWFQLFYSRRTFRLTSFLFIVT